MSVSIFGYQQDHYFMTQALAQAQLAAQHNEVPIGAIVVDGSGTIIGSAYNGVEQIGCQIAHAEMQAITQATQKTGDWRLLDCWLYVTLEPCAMCMGLIRLSRLKGIVYATGSPVYGFRLDNTALSHVYQDDTLIIINNVLKEEATIILKTFFQQKRKCERG